MSTTINSNINSLTAQRQLNSSQNALTTALTRLSSGLRINSAKDDAAGLAISERFTSQIRGLDQAVRNANDGISLAQTAEGALKSASDMLQRIRELAVQSSNSTNSAGDRQALNQEVTQLVSELDRVATSTEFNGQKLLDGTFGSAKYQVGANANQTIIAATANMRTSVYGNQQNVAAGLAAQASGATAPVNGIFSGTLAVYGGLGSGSVNVAISESSKVTADSINAKTASTGVTASARTMATISFSAAGSYTLDLTGGSAQSTQAVSFTLVGGNTSADVLSTAVQAINDKTSKTGITAELDATAATIVLTDNSGYNISLGRQAAVTNGNTVLVINQNVDTAGTMTAVGSAVTLSASGAASYTTVGGFLTVDSDKSFNVTTGGGGNISFATSGNSTLKKVSNLDVSTYVGAQDALKTVDSALKFISGERAKLGALQSRFDSTVSSLQISSENMSAARSRIQDADFASETANLSRAQILQQAGTAMVAQANQLPQGVLALLR
jgi:flagellin